MLETITSAHFVALLDKSCWAELDGGELELTVHSVREYPDAWLPNNFRTPFKVLFRRPESPALTDGLCTLRVDGPEGWRLREVYINRVVPPPGSERGTYAYYQLAFS